MRYYINGILLFIVNTLFFAWNISCCYTVGPIPDYIHIILGLFNLFSAFIMCSYVLDKAMKIDKLDLNDFNLGASDYDGFVYYLNEINDKQFEYWSNKFFGNK